MARKYTGMISNKYILLYSWDATNKTTGELEQSSFHQVIIVPSHSQPNDICLLFNTCSAGNVNILPDFIRDVIKLNESELGKIDF